MHILLNVCYFGAVLYNFSISSCSTNSDSLAHQSHTDNQPLRLGSHHSFYSLHISINNRDKLQWTITVPPCTYVGGNQNKPRGNHVVIWTKQSSQCRFWRSGLSLGQWSREEAALLAVLWCCHFDKQYPSSYSQRRAHLFYMYEFHLFLTFPTTFCH